MIVYQKMIYREDLKRNPDVLYLFGDNNQRVGFGGQAREMRGEHNAVGIRTKWSPDMSGAAFFYDRDFPEATQMIKEDFERVFEKLSLGGVVVIPADGLGTGLSSLPETAPKIYSWLLEYIKGIEDYDSDKYA